MQTNEQQQLQYIVILTAGFRDDTLTDKQARQLDDWISDNDENMLLMA